MLDKLPLLVQLKIFSFFDLNEKYGVLKLICKSLKNVVEFTEFESICFYRFHDPFQWLQKSHEEEFRITDANNDGSWLGEFCFRTLQMIQAYQTGSFCGHLLLKLNAFDELRELRLYENLKLSGDFRIDLKKLKLLSIKCAWHHHGLFSENTFSSQITLDTPSLEKLIFWGDLNFIEFVSQKLRYVECEVFRPKRLYQLEHVICLHFNARLDMRSYSKLKRIEIYPRDPVSNEFKRSHLNFCPQDLDLKIMDTKNSFRSQFRMSESQLGSPVYHLRNEHLQKIKANEASSVIPWEISIEYPHICKKLNQLPGKSSILSSVVEIRVQRPKYQNELGNNLLKFLKQCKHLKRLKLEFCNLGKTFYQDLFASKHLALLNIQEKFVDLQPIISQLRNVHCFTLTATGAEFQEPSYQPIQTAFENSNCLHNLRLSIVESDLCYLRITIRRLSPTKASKGATKFQYLLCIYQHKSYYSQKTFQFPRLESLESLIDILDNTEETKLVRSCCPDRSHTVEGAFCVGRGANPFFA